MGKSLIIAEKPNVAKQLLQSPRFKNIKRKQGSKPYYGYFENENYIITWARGHLYEVMNPGEHNESLKEFKFDNLPIILPVKYKAIEDSKEQIQIINELIHRTDVIKIVNACDNDKEGELLFREIFEQAQTNKPLFRIWLSSYEIGEIEASFNRLLDGKDFESLADSARARQYLDHLIGDTLTRACTVKFANNQFLLSGGRVQICLLNEIRKRELEVEQFTYKTFYNLYTNTGFLSQYQSDKEYILDPQPLKELEGRLNGHLLTVKEYQNKESKRNAPNLFNATDFLKACIQKLSITAPQAKGILQKLYEEGLVSYPRSDSRHLPTSMVNSIQDIIHNLGKTTDYEKTVETIDSSIISSKHRCFNDDKVTSHYAIIPTKKPFPEGKNELEKSVYDLIVKRFLCNWQKPATYTVREIILSDQEGNLFTSKEKVLIDKGYLEVYQDEIKEEESAEPILNQFTIPITNIGETFTVKECIIKTGQTRKPPYHTETSILSFMETAGRNLVEDDEIRELLKGKRIGTAATAESFIPKLIERGYIIDDKGKLRTSSLGSVFIDSLPLEKLKNPTFTAEMEENITKIEQKLLSYSEFREEILYIAHNIVDRMSNVDTNISKLIEKARNHDVEIGPCICKKGRFIDKKSFYGCTNFPECEIRLPKIIKEQVIPAKQILNLIIKGETDLIKGFKDQEGNSFEAIIIYSDGQLKFRKENLGQCPKCKKGEIKKNSSKEGKVFFGCSAYTTGCTFSIPGTIKEKKLPEGQIKKLLKQRTTDFISGFLSNGKEFTARIIVKEDGNLQMLLPTEEDKTLGKCPLCKGRVKAGKAFYICENYKKTCKFILSPIFGKKEIPIKQIVKLLDKNLTDLIKGFKNQDETKVFNAKLSYDIQAKRLKYVFELKKKF
jgi:DNA topoisomerase I